MYCGNKIPLQVWEDVKEIAKGLLESKIDITEYQRHHLINIMNGVVPFGLKLSDS